MNVNAIQLKVHPEYEALLPKLPKEEYEALKLSIQNEGQHHPIIVNEDGIILDGHHRFQICNELGLKPKTDVRRFEDKLLEKKFVISSNLFRRQLTTFQRIEMAKPLIEIEQCLAKERMLRGDPRQNFAEGKTTEIMAVTIGTNPETLRQGLWLIENAPENILDQLRSGDLSIFGAYDSLKPCELPPEEQNGIPEIEKIHTDIQRGDIYQLGKHRLMCGDATNKQDIETLMDGQKADLLLTDPPYGINVVGRNGKVGVDNVARCKVYGDFEGDKNFDLSPILDYDKYRKAVIFGGNYFTDVLPITNSWLVWDKRAGAHSWFSDCELVWSNLGCGPKILKFTWQGMIREGSRETRVHPTQKPVQILFMILMELSKDAKIVLDLFGGSGSTLIASEQANRSCYMMEIDPRYCQVIIDRWEAYTKQKAQKVN